MTFRFALALAALAAVASIPPAVARDAAAADSSASAPDPIDALPWQRGPTVGAMGERASIKVPEGYVFLDAKSTRRLDELMENPAPEADEFALAPADLHWLAFFSFDEIGFVKDDEQVDADAVLESLRKGTEANNAVRRERGWDTLKVVGWSARPEYDKDFKALAWAVLLENEQSKGQSVNYNTRLLGRRGVMNVVLVSNPDAMAASIAEFKATMPGYRFGDGEKYADFRPGDHVAEIGLAALITGGAAAVAAKKGVFAAIAIALAKAWKLLLIGVAAGGAWLRRLFGRKPAPAVAETTADSGEA